MYLIEGYFSTFIYAGSLQGGDSDLWPIPEHAWGDFYPLPYLGGGKIPKLGSLNGVVPAGIPT